MNLLHTTASLLFTCLTNSLPTLRCWPHYSHFPNCPSNQKESSPDNPAGSTAPLQYISSLHGSKSPSPHSPPPPETHTLSPPKPLLRKHTLLSRLLLHLGPRRPPKTVAFSPQTKPYHLDITQPSRTWREKQRILIRARRGARRKQIEKEMEPWMIRELEYSRNREWHLACWVIVSAGCREVEVMEGMGLEPYNDEEDSDVLTSASQDREKAGVYLAPEKREGDVMVVPVKGFQGDDIRSAHAIAAERKEKEVVEWAGSSN
ncbi:hypothetical protein BJ508DRAFT_334254 [Ascobolus immersus RN42]|uniref:Uncharacterized protein n=1 Tax=Ascobolus immersus RN42 TaxID=1160509 RepID=A0A3N4HL20_ASCIM|nr:hypothetical protein BJ508DRAFT_334254 [Ascobolus immersus RN42]